MESTIEVEKKVSGSLLLEKRALACLYYWIVSEIKRVKVQSQVLRSLSKLFRYIVFHRPLVL